MKAKSIKGASPEEIKTALQQSMADDFKPTLAIVFLSIQHDRELLGKLLQEKGMAVFGATTSGEFMDGDIGEGSIVIMLLEIDTSWFTIRFADVGKQPARETASNIAAEGKKVFQNPAFIIAISGWGFNSEMVVQGFEDVTGGRNILFGGIAGDDGTGNGSYVFTPGKNSSDALLTLIIDSDKIAVEGIATCGWKPVGTVRTITKSEGNTVYTIDHEPALQVLTKFLADSPTDVKTFSDTLLLTNHAYYPILLQRKDAPPIVRAAVRTNPDEGSVLFAGGVPQGTKFRFTLPPDFEVMDEAVAQAGKELTRKGMAGADALLLFSCVSRKVIFGPLAGHEVQGLKDLWQSPLAGFYSHGEIGKTSGGQYELHNNTCCVVALKEK